MRLSPFPTTRDWLESQQMPTVVSADRKACESCAVASSRPSNAHPSPPISPPLPPKSERRAAVCASQPQREFLPAPPAQKGATTGGEGTIAWPQVPA
ncbi:hypothetical protein K431DRAFT_283369 [Polychaeton citri CBS 116435]|uniref:Uncharacterized protein n=1 Tax=Polychaeton citri CBS 116435 TaxID=1314669 RepID=A0A9P4QE28_9PEZI|nr:hypothetical protein K431DRAFT_283369 [Polychaeton citri CBS 116435]